MVDFAKALEVLTFRNDLLKLPVRLAGTGHRPNKLGGYNATRRDHAGIRKLMNDTENVIKQVKPDLVISGGALGFDQYLAVCAAAAGIPLFLALPCKPFGDNWPEKSLGSKLHRFLIAKAAYVHYVTPMSYEQAGKDCMQWRNEYMVDNATDLVACWDGSKGGTGNCVDYAWKRQQRQEHEGQPSLSFHRIWNDEYRIA